MCTIIKYLYIPDRMPISIDLVSNKVYEGSTLRPLPPR
jgi:hypothetical protein